MSDLGVIDYLFNKKQDSVDLNMEFNPDMDMDLPLNYENTDFMSSEFFDSIFSLEKCNLENGTLEADILSTLDTDIVLNDNSLPGDEIQCDNSTYSDSGLSSDQHDLDLCDGQIEDDLFKVVPKPEIKSESKTTVNPNIILPSVNGRKVVISKSDANCKPKIINIIKPIQKPKQVLRVQPISGNTRSVLLPFNIKDLKTIKIINANELKAENIKIQSPVTERAYSRQKSEYIVPSPDSIKTEEEDGSDTREKIEDNQYPLLTLTAEEKRLLSKDGIQLPCRYPLTKHEERELKRIRRKIRNKISAQDSRKRKKEYVDGLEERVKQCSEENRSLMKRIKFLQSQNSKLTTQLGKLQALVFKTGSSRAHPATCLMIVMLSALLVSLPNLRNHGENAETNALQQYAARRALLYSQQATTEDTLNMEEFLHFPSKESVEIDMVPLDEGIGSDDNNTSSDETSIDKSITMSRKRSSQIDYGGIQNAKGYIEPDIDYDYRPPKKQKVLVAPTKNQGFMLNTMEDK